MTSQLLDAPACAVGALANGVDALAGLDLASLSPVELAELLRQVESQRRRLEAVDQALLACPTMRDVAFEAGATSVASLLTTSLRVSRREATARARRAESLGPRTTLTGEPLPPLCPGVAAACASGEISAEHADQIIGALDKLPAHLPPEATPAVEAFLVQAAQYEDPGALRRTVQAVAHRLDPDGAEPDDERAERGRSFTIADTRSADGTYAVRGGLTPEARALIRAALDPLSKPCPAADGTADPRTVGQRGHDALVDLAERVLRSGTLPESGGVTAAVVIRCTVNATTDALDPLAHVGDDVVPIVRLGSLLDCAEVTTVRLSAAGGVLSYGRELRTATCAQRRALAARDGGCSFPGCTRPPSWCQTHHVLTWLDDGLTEIDNLVLVCGYHHRTFERSGWRVVMTDGVPDWIPPPGLDLAQRPRRNTVHHLPEIRFDAPG